MDLRSLEIRMARSENLPTLPQVASQVLKLADDSDSNPREFEKAVELDPAVTAKILKIANSAYYGSTNVPTIGRAISFLGLSQVRSVVVGIAMQQMSAGKNSCANLNKLELWRHSLAVAIACRIMGKLKHPGWAEELYCAGMLHEIGMLAMEKFVPQELHQAIGRAQSTGTSVNDVSMDVSGFSPSEAGFVLAKSWGLSPIIQSAIHHWHNPRMDENHYETTAIVAFAKNMALSLGFNHSGLDKDTTLDLMLANEIELPEGQFDIIGEVVVNEVGKAQEAFQIAA
ncbi:MAG: HDOD domain-containing protein [Chthonomonadaceae bacterium]|nr:HDOD domain-containing protein [Chthonomonadaceae bacterium]